MAVAALPMRRRGAAGLREYPEAAWRGPPAGPDAFVSNTIPAAPRNTTPPGWTRTNGRWVGSDDGPQTCRPDEDCEGRTNPMSVAGACGKCIARRRRTTGQARSGLRNAGPEHRGSMSRMNDSRQATAREPSTLRPIRALPTAGNGPFGIELGCRRLRTRQGRRLNQRQAQRPKRVVRQVAPADKRAWAVNAEGTRTSREALDRPVAIRRRATIGPASAGWFARHSWSKRTRR
jgi:hypothetical protein